MSVPVFLKYMPSRTPVTDPATKLAARIWQDFFNGLVKAANEIVLVGQGAAVAASSLIASTAQSGGRYRVSTYSRISSPATTSSSVQITIAWTDGGVPQSQTFTAVTGNATTSQRSDARIIVADSNTDITYAIAYASVGADAAVYTATIIAEQLP